MKKIVLCIALVLGLAPIAELSSHADTPPAAALTDAGPSSAAAGSAFVVSSPVVLSPATPAPAVVVVDPTAAASADVADLGTILVQYGPIWGGALLVFTLWGGVLKKNESTHWIAQGRALALITTGLMGFGALLKWKLGGGAAAGAGMTPILGILKLFNPLGPGAAGSTTPAASARSGAPALVLLVVLAFGGSQLTACGTSAQQRQTTLQAALATTDAACTTFAAYDLKHQHDLEAAAIASHATFAEVTDTIARWRVKRAPAQTACKTVYDAIKAAATVTDDQTLKAITAAAGILAGALQTLGVSL